MSTLGERIKIARRNVRPRMTQHDLAKRLNVTQGAIGQWETGAANPEPARLERIAKFCEVDVRWLLTGSGRPETVNPKEERLKKALQEATEKTNNERLARLEVEIDSLKRTGPAPAARSLAVYGKIQANFQPTFVKPMETLNLEQVFDPSKRYGVLVSGQSMTPTAIEGDICLVEPVQWELPEYDDERGPADKKFWANLHGEVVCASVNGEDAILKRMHISDRKDTGFKVSLVSDNPANPMIEVTRKDRLRILGIVRYILRNPKQQK